MKIIVIIFYLLLSSITWGQNHYGGISFRYEILSRIKIDRYYLKQFHDISSHYSSGLNFGVAGLFLYKKKINIFYSLFYKKNKYGFEYTLPDSFFTDIGWSVTEYKDIDKALIIVDIIGVSTSIQYEIYNNEINITGGLGFSFYYPIRGFSYSNKYIRTDNKLYEIFSIKGSVNNKNNFFISPSVSFYLKKVIFKRTTIFFQPKFELPIHEIYKSNYYIFKNPTKLEGDIYARDGGLSFGFGILFSIKNDN